MAFVDDQTSVSDSAPVELFRFTTPQTTYFRTTFQEDFEFDGDLYLRITGMRTPNQVDAPGSASDLEVTIPVDDPIIQANVVGQPPVMRVTMLVELLRYQQVSAEAELWWSGPVRGVGVANRGRAATLRVPDGMADALRADVPRPRAQRGCNHGLYDSMCKILESDHDHPTTVDAVSGLTVTVDSFDPVESYNAGQMIFNGERREIVKQDGANMTLDAPFRGLVSSSPVTLLAGCDHTASRCSSHFVNIRRFGGGPGLPTKNPHVHIVVVP